jgi:hypothetical protein
LKKEKKSSSEAPKWSIFFKNETSVCIFYYQKSRMLFGIDKEAWPVCRSTIIIINKQQQSWSIKGGHAVNQ